MNRSSLRSVLHSRLRALGTGYRFARAYGSRLNAAGVLVEWADSLELRREGRATRRAARLYRRAERTLSPVLNALHVAAPINSASTADSSHRLLRTARAPYRAALASIVQLGLLLGFASVLVFALACVCSSQLRHRWFPIDLAAGRAWHASSSWGGYPLQGIGPTGSGPIFFHTQESEQPWLEVDLGAEHSIRAVGLVNRTDCCQMRAVPVDVRIQERGEWRSIAERRAPFKTWTRDVEPVRARFVRVQLPGSGMLHLKRVSIYGE